MIAADYARLPRKPVVEASRSMSIIHRAFS